MIRHSNNITGLTALAALALLTGCRSDQGEPLPVHGEGSSLSLLIPVPAMSAYAPGTRAGVHGSGADVTAAEGTIHTLYMLAYPHGETHVKPSFIHSFTADDAKPVDGMYVSYTTDDVKPGTYDIYLVANIDKYTSTSISNSILYNSLRYVPLNYPDTDDCVTPQNKDGYGLPMVGRCLEVTVSSDGTTSVVAPMEFLCSKVRLTVLFDASGDGAPSEDFGIGSTFRIQDNPEWNNLRWYTVPNQIWEDPYNPYLLYRSKAEPNSKVASDYGYRAVYPATEYDEDIDSWLSSLLEEGGKALNLPAADDDMTTEGSPKMAWQTTCYIDPFDTASETKNVPAPSMLLKAVAEDKTGAEMNTFEYTFFPGCSGTVVGGDCTSWLEPGENVAAEPGHMYDMVVVVTDPGKFLFKIKDMKWEYVREETDL